MSLIPSLTTFPLFGVTYGLAGVVCGLLWLRGHKNKVLRSLSAVILVIAALNISVEEWGGFQRSRFENAALFLIGFLLWAYATLCIRLMEEVGVAGGRTAFLSSFLPFFSVVLVGLALALPSLLKLENPPLALYMFIVLICFIHVPAFAYGKTQAMRAPIEDSNLGLSTSLLRRAIVALVAPLLVELTLQAVLRDDWRLFSLNVGMTLAIVALLLVSLNGRNLFISQRLS